MEWDPQGCGISMAEKDTSMLPSQETGRKANIGFGCLALCYPPKGSIFQLSDAASGSTNAVSLGRGYLFGLTNGNWHLALLVMQKLQTSAFKVMMHMTVKTATLEC